LACGRKDGGSNERGRDPDQSIRVEKEENHERERNRKSVGGGIVEEKICICCCCRYDLMIGETGFQIAVRDHIPQT
jgi:hypothetical protein